MGCLPIDDLIVDSIKSVRPLVLIHGGVASASYPDCFFSIEIFLVSTEKFSGFVLELKTFNDFMNNPDESVSSVKRELRRRYCENAPGM